MNQEAILVSDQHGRTLVIGVAKRIHERATSLGYQVYSEMYLPGHFSEQQLFTLCSVTAVFVPSLVLLGETQEEVAQALDGLRRIFVEAVFVVGPTGELLRIDSDTVEVLRLFRALDVVLRPGRVA